MPLWPPQRTTVGPIAIVMLGICTTSTCTISIIARSRPPPTVLFHTRKLVVAATTMSRFPAAGISTPSIRIARQAERASPGSGPIRGRLRSCRCPTVNGIIALVQLSWASPLGRWSGNLAHESQVLSSRPATRRQPPGSKKTVTPAADKHPPSHLIDGCSLGTWKLTAWFAMQCLALTTLTSVVRRFSMKTSPGREPQDYGWGW